MSDRAPVAWVFRSRVDGEWSEWSGPIARDPRPGLAPPDFEVLELRPVVTEGDREPSERHYRVTASGQASVDPGALKDSPLAQAATTAARRQAADGRALDPAWELADLIVCSMVGARVAGSKGGSLSVDRLRDEWNARLRAFLAEREVETAKKLRAGAGDVVEIFLDARPPGTVDLVYDRLARAIGLPEDCHGE